MNPENDSPVLTLAARLESLTAFLDAVARAATDLGFSRQRIQDMRLAAEEILVNIFHYAYPAGDGTATLVCRPTDDKDLVLEFRDFGVPFDVVAHKDPDVSCSIAERKIGGLGVFLVKKLADSVEYKRDNQENVLTVTFHHAG